MKIKFSNGLELPIIMCYNNGKKRIAGETRVNREIHMPADVIALDDLHTLLSNPANLETIEVTGDDGDTEVLVDFVYPGEIRYDFNGEVCFSIGAKTALEIENELAIKAIDELLIAMEV